MPACRPHRPDGVNRADWARTGRAAGRTGGGRPLRWVSGTDRYALGVSTRAPGRNPGISGRSDRRSPKLAFELSEPKLHAPAARPGIVSRTALVDRLAAAHTPPVIAVVAPPGYGKTTVLSQWAERRQPRVGWVSADVRDNDPTVLLTYIAAAIDRIERINPAVFRALASPAAAMSAPPLLVSAIAALGQPVSLVLDHLEVITNRACLDAIVQFALGLPAGSQLAVGSRHELPLPTARLRAQGGMVEIGVDDLAMREGEAPALLQGAGLELLDEDVRDLVQRTEGWPVGLYLAALAIKAGSPHPEVGLTFTGDDRFMGDYLRSEILDRVSPAEATFLTRTSILDAVSGPLCDATLGATGSSGSLEKLEGRNLLVMPLDHRREWYRYHHLFRELLSTELRRREPDLVPQLHLRAAAWCEANGMPETAIEHAQAAGDADRVARVTLNVANAVWASGRADTVLRWMKWFEEQGLVGSYPGIAVHGALMFALMGEPGEAERWAVAAERAPSVGTLDDGNTVEGTVAYLRALLGRDGVDAMRRDAQIALSGLSPASPYRATMVYTEGVSHLLDGDLDRADAILAHALDATTAARVQPFVPVVLATRGIVAIERDAWDEAEAFADQAGAVMREGHFDDYWTSALVYAWTARVALHRGDVMQGREHVARAARLRRLLTYALPVVSVQALLEMGRAYVALADPAGGRTVLRQINDILRQRPKLGGLPRQAEDLRLMLDTIRGGAPGASSLTTAELRLVPLLSTHLSFREIGERLYVSRHTVKTQAISVYRKLGVSSRSEAITRMRMLGLLPHA
jgi:LuxR family transcriptional regulator, maltose regulon positive regulatory protein